MPTVEADTFCVELTNSELEEQYRNAHFKYVRKEIEAENGVEDFCFRYRIVQEKRNCRAERPEQREVCDDLVSREYREGQYQRVERAEMEGKIFERRIPRDEVVYDRGDAREGKNTEDDDLHLPSAAFEYKVKRYVQRDSENKTEYMRGAKGTPSHDRIVSLSLLKIVQTYNMIP